MVTSAATSLLIIITVEFLSLVTTQSIRDARLRQAAKFLAGTALIRPVSIAPNTILGEFDAVEHDFADVKDQEHVKRAMSKAVSDWLKSF